MSAVRPPDVINLERLRLRRPTLADAPAIFEYASDPEVARYADWPISTSLESVTEHLHSREAEWNAGVEFHWVVTLPPDDRSIGAIACTISNHTAEFGYVFARRFWRNGYATEAARGIVEWILSVPTVWRVSATCDIDNRASARVLEKAGLTREGTLRRAMARPNLPGAPRDAFLYSKVRE